MPRRCCVDGCLSNSTQQKENNSETIPTFSFPVDSNLKLKWIAAIRKPNWEPSKYSAVCIQHFLPEQVQKNLMLRNENTNYPISRSKLLNGTIPTVFPGQPHQHEPSSKRKPPEKRLQEINCRIEKNNEAILQADMVKGYQDILQNYKEKLNKNILTEYKTFEQKASLTFYIVDEDLQKGCNFKIRIVICSDLKVNIFTYSDLVNKQDLIWILPNTLKLTLWSQLENLLVRYKNFENVNTSEDFNTLLENALNVMNLALENIPDDFDYNNEVLFLTDQIKLLLMKSKILYSQNTMIVSHLFAKRWLDSTNSGGATAIFPYLCYFPRNYS